eukprot:CAMPEP_0170061286 /NCGR_PEP_ID=MMETSP0019_2-20121128/2905_1 /TAXON_ID=98059 /ORGANISM="Dinobryon sp., Strain UTEXLB2267" /LENGTH=588 /DNA_ID=CAMNT_0010267067 /DNA_START=208 /DNA_END=1977 /DNA_ORIENTATION=-
MPVYFLTGTDEHGQKVQQSAINANKSPIEFADDVSNKFRDLISALNCTNNDFIRTTETRHKDAVHELWHRLEQKNQIYLGAYEGWYSVRDEAFYAETELVNGKAPTGAEVEWVKEESYFFRLSDWTQKLLTFYEENPNFIGPKGRRNEVISFVAQEGGLKDLSISRTTFSWGIPVPNDPKHVVYVWLDALTNYLTALGFPNEDNELYRKFWPAHLHVVGKDILRFHAVFWPAFLMAADLAPPKRVFAHGWWTKDGEKMSKSVGNVLDPWDLINSYGLDYLRYYLVAEINFGNDGDFSHESMCSRINTDLANDLGNLAQRALTMIFKNCEGKVPTPGGPFTAEDEKLLLAAKEQLLPAIRVCLAQQNMKGVCDAIIDVAKMGNRYIDLQAPWHLLKNDVPRMHTVLYVLVELLRCTSILLEPVMPASCSRLLDLLGVPEGHMRSFSSVPLQDSSKPITLSDPNLIAMNQLLGGKPYPVFPKLDVDSGKEVPVTTSNSNKAKATPAVGVEVDYVSKYGAQLDDVVAVGVLVTQLGNTIREMKKAKRTVEEEISGKALLKEMVQELTFLKDRYKTLNNGVAADPASAVKAQ